MERNWIFNNKRVGGTGVMEATALKTNKRSSVSTACSPTETSWWIWSLRRACGQFQLFPLFKDFDAGRGALSHLFLFDFADRE